MLFIRHLRDPRRRFVAGQICLVLGILIGRFGPRLLFMEEGSFGAAFLDGFSLSLLVLSVPLNMSGLRQVRRADRSGRGPSAE